MRKLIAVSLAMAMLLCGCGSLLQKEYVTVVPHTEQYEAVEDTDVLTVENFAGLKNAILSFVEAGMEYGVIRVSNYDGDITEDVTSAAYEVARNDPLGAYAIDYLTHDYSRIVSYYELHFYITYRRSTEDIQAIKRVYNNNEAREEMTNLIAEVGETVALRYSYYNETDFDLLTKQIRESEPELDLGEPQVTAELYPESGVQRIAELNFSYSVPTEQLLEMRESMAEQVDDVNSAISAAASDELKAYRLFKWLTDHVQMEGAVEEPAEEETQDAFADTAYGALVQRKASPRGFAMAYLALCESMGIECQIVYGRRNGYDHYWNIIKLGEDYYHVDACSAAEYGFGGFLLRDDDMVSYRWEREEYPECSGQLTYYDVVPGFAEAEEPAFEPSFEKIEEN